MTARQGTRTAWIAWAATCLIWGTTYLAIKIALDTIPPFLMGGLRFVASGILLAMFLLVRGRRLPPRADWGRLAGVGVVLLAAGNGGVVWGEQFISSGLTAVLIGTSPFWMVGVDSATGGRRLHPREWFGLIVGFIGIVMLVWPDISAGGVTGRQMVIGLVSVQIACAGWAIGSIFTRRQVASHDILGAAAIQLFVAGIFMVGIGTAMGEWSRLGFNPKTTAALIYLIVFGAVIAFAAYSYALHHLDVAIVSLYTYINPVIAVILGMIILDEPFHFRMVVAAAVIVVGLLIVAPGRRA